MYNHNTPRIFDCESNQTPPIESSNIRVGVGGVTPLIYIYIYIYTVYIYIYIAKASVCKVLLHIKTKIQNAL